MENNCGITCIIPFYNEGERIFSVLEAVTGLGTFDQIICVDDGSEDDTLARIRQRWPRLTVMRMPENRGKTAAIKRALEAVESPYVMLMDADLRNLEPDELAQIVRMIGTCPDVDMLILRRLNAEWFVRMNRADVLLSGERILRTDDLRAVLAGPVDGFQLEMAINEYMWKHQKEVCWVPWSAKNTYKMDKRGTVDGFLKDVMMYADVLQYIGVVSFVRQMAGFARKPLRGRPVLT
ncbi:glycosyltransferase family 2 protein [Larkinella insperata]|uniref:Glycosyltransferase family 2 protein n=1 Tax=Larkinella insperata TaxID=332158 RepID=A0ABW3QKJ1_9BACT|nr:glycosyltransferase family 2 protein [Larkinella insperata]